MFAAFAKGLMRSMLSERSLKLDIIPSDIVVNGIIAAAWKAGQSWSKGQCDRSRGLAVEKKKASVASQSLRKAYCEVQGNARKRTDVLVCSFISSSSVCGPRLNGYAITLL